MLLPPFASTIQKGYLYAYISFLEDPPAPTPTSSKRLPAQDAADDKMGGERSGEAGGGNSCVIMVSVDSSSDQFQDFRRTRAVLESRFRSALGSHWDRYLGNGATIERKTILTKFCTQMKALHFFYCLRGRWGGAPGVTQCLSCPFIDSVANDPTAQRNIWGCYVRAALRLRRGSCQEGRVFYRAEGDGDGFPNGVGGGYRAPSGKEQRPWGTGTGSEEDVGGQATALFESDPVHSLAYEVGGKLTVVSLFGRRDDGSAGGRRSSSSSAGDGSWGERDELHACFPHFISPEVAYKAAIRLLEIVRRDREWLFITGTGAPK